VERRYSSYSFTTSALEGGEWSASRPGRALPPGKGPPIPIVQEAGWVQFNKIVLVKQRKGRVASIESYLLYIPLRTNRPLP
jgi:hypothetical protein